MLEEALEALLKQLDHSPLPESAWAESRPFSIMNQGHQTVLVKAEIVYNSLSANFYVRARLLLAKEVHRDLPLMEVFNMKPLLDEVAFRNWCFEKAQHEPSFMDVYSKVEVRPTFRDSGIGSVLLKKGESIKRSIAQKVEPSFEVTHLINNISDSSGNNWTSKRVRNSLRGYQETTDPYDKSKVFIKSETL